MNPKILVTMHHPEEGPGVLGEFLASRGGELLLCRLYQGEALPEGDFDAVISMGGPMNVYEELMHPWLAPEADYLGQAARAGVPVMGICLGAQLLARGLGARVVDSPAKELGWYPVELTPAAGEDPLFAGVAGEFEVFQWHGDMFEIPEGAGLLALGRGCPHQAFGYKRAYGLQFHVEVTQEIVAKWCETPEQEEIVSAGWETSGQDMAVQGQVIFGNFLKLITKRA